MVNSTALLLQPLTHLKTLCPLDENQALQVGVGPESCFQPGPLPDLTPSSEGCISCRWGHGQGRPVCSLVRLTQGQLGHVQAVEPGFLDGRREGAEHSCEEGRPS